MEMYGEPKSYSMQKHIVKKFWAFRHFEFLGSYFPSSSSLVSLSSSGTTLPTPVYQGV